jgi:hypothetical protein
MHADSPPRLPVVQSFWHGRVSTMERLSAASFIANGHEMHVYAYDALPGLPDGAVVHDAATIVPTRTLRPSVYRDSRGSFSSFANMFRYKLLLEQGGWWVDLDTVCVRPFDLADDYVFPLEPDGTVSNGTFRVPPSSEVMAYAYERCRSLGRRRREWGVTGPRLLGEAVAELGLERHVVPHEVFIPVAWQDWEMFLDPARAWDFPATTLAVHLFNALWVRGGRDKDGDYPAGCLYEQLKERYLSAPSR